MLRKIALSGVRDFRGCKPLVWRVRRLVSKDRKLSVTLDKCDRFTFTFARPKTLPSSWRKGNSASFRVEEQPGAILLPVPGLDRSLLIQSWIPSNGQWSGEE